MKLHKFDVADNRTRAICSSNSIAGCDIWISRLLEDSAKTAGCEQNASREDSYLSSLFAIAGDRPRDLAVVNQQIGNRRKASELNVPK